MKNTLKFLGNNWGSIFFFSLLLYMIIFNKYAVTHTLLFSIGIVSVMIGGIWLLLLHGIIFDVPGAINLRVSKTDFVLIDIYPMPTDRQLRKWFPGYPNQPTDLNWFLDSLNRRGFLVYTGKITEQECKTR